MKSEVRQRNVQSPDKAKNKRRVSWHNGVVDNNMKNRSNDLYLSWHFVLVYLLLIATMSAISLHFFWTLPEPVRSSNSPNQFQSWRARGHMEDLTALGVRHVGSAANEIHAKNLIINKVESIREKASTDVEIEISVQHPSGSFYIDFLGGITHIYQNVTNIVVRVSRKGSDRSHAFLVNAHYDSALGTVAASDDAISCGIMLEAIRCLTSDPAPLLGEHALIFLFNGAEETFLQASHGFVTQHPWAKTVRAFLNLEAAGAGGREIVFQTGPDHPWLATLYSESAPHPHASIIAQEVFQSGVIQSDTDFRIFRDFGHIPGIDTAYIANGYIYHTEYDLPSAIPDGSIQRAGENTLAILRKVADAPQLSDPSAEDRHGKVIFFDIFGLMTVVYPEWVSMVMNFALALLVALSFVKGINWSGSEDSDKPAPKLFLVSLGVTFLSWLAAVVTAVLVAALLTLLGRSMSWFSNPLLIIPLYIVPSFLALGEVHTQLVKRSHVPQSQLEKSSFLSTQFLWCVVLVLLTSLRICSAFLFFVILSFQLIFRTFLHDLLISPELRKSGFHSMRVLAFVLCSAFAVGLPWMLRLQMDVGLLQLFVPLTGRSGALVPPDLAIGILTALLVVTTTPYMIGILIYSTSKEFKLWSGVLLLAISLLAIVMVAMGCFNPYSTADKAFPKPKRLFLVHTDRTFYASDQSVSREDSQVMIYPYDYLGLAPVAEVSPLFREAKLSKCETGLLCSEPLYVPVRHLINSWSLPASRLSDREGAFLTLISSQRTSDNSKNMTFQAKFPVRSTMVIGTDRGVSLKAWSLESYIPPINNCPGSHQDTGCYFVFLARGFGEGEFTFWMEIQSEGSAVAQEPVTMAVSAHYLDPPQSETADISKLANDLPEWVTAVSWSVVYKEWIF